MSNEAVPVKRLFNIFEELGRLTAATPKGLPTRMLKLTNEVGELAQAVDIAEGNAGTKYRDVEDPIADVLEEAIDVLLVDGSLIIQLMRDHNINPDRVLEVIEQKMAKWQKVLELDGAV
ncbi:hypothetical protein D3C80_1190470 [compost metagenome]